MEITLLPSEILDIILENENLAISDVMSFALTCKQFYQDVTTSNTLWKTKTLQRWDVFKKVFKNEEVSEVTQINWFEEMKAQIFRRKQLKKYLSEMSAKHYYRLHNSFNYMNELDVLFLPDIDVRLTNYYLWMEELSAIRIKDETNLSDKYYASRIAPYMSHTYVTKEWQKFLALPAKKQTIERVMLLVSQWMKPCALVHVDDIFWFLDFLARVTRTFIAKDHPDLLINRTAFAEETEWKNEILDDNKWSDEDSKIIISTLCETMFITMGFRIYFSLRTVGIEQVLATRRDNGITLMTILEAVGRRLGLRFEIVEHRDYSLSWTHSSLLRWKARSGQVFCFCNIPEDDGIAGSYFDVFFRESSLRSEDETSYELPALTAVEIAILVAGRIDWETTIFQQLGAMHWSKELLHMISPRKMSHIFRLIYFYIQNGINFGKLIESLKDIRNKNEWLDPNDYIGFYEGLYRIVEKIKKKHLLEPPKTRLPQVQYAVGMIVKDRSNVMSVITGWDATKNDNADGRIVQELSNLRYGNKQPFYSIYREDRSHFYVPQEILTVAQSPEEIGHLEIGRYFTEFKGRYYLPNVATSRMYPEDAKLLSELYEC